MSAAGIDMTRSVLVTGASTGIGAACALELHRRGFRVFAGVRKAADGLRLQEQASRLLAPLMIDVTDPASIGEAVKTVAGSLDGGRLAGLVNNAGIMVGGPLETLPPSELRRQLEVNVVGQVAVTQAMLPLLRQCRGRIVNIGSFSGRVAVPYSGAYAASKFALEAITDAWRIELRRWGVFVSIVEPGSVKTPIWGKAQDEADRVLGDMTRAAETLYGDDMRAMREASLRLAASGMPVERVVRAVVHALTARRPRTRYPLGAQTHLAFFAFKFLPDRVRDWLVRRDLGLK
jgi:NAD(P)-dependent dehydrogenase (short-subunit alcohol dehydrogenase family)